MGWSIQTTDVFDDWFDGLSREEKVEIESKLELLIDFGPNLRRPHADTWMDHDMPT